MPYLDLDQRLVTFKIVYSGPGSSGKTTNLRFVHKVLAEKYKGEMLELDTDEERTLFFDFFPVFLGDIDGFSLRFHLYTIPGQIYYEASRKIILQGADGVVFVADSTQDRLEENIESFLMMQQNLMEENEDFSLFPLVLQYNKRDVEPRLELGSIEKRLNMNCSIPVTEAIAITGQGVMHTLNLVSKEVIKRFRL